MEESNHIRSTKFPLSFFLFNANPQGAMHLRLGNPKKIPKVVYTIES